MTAWLFNRVNAITVRDEGSKDELLAIGVEKNIVVTADPVLGIANDTVGMEPGRQILQRNGVTTGAVRSIGVFIRPWQDNLFLPELAAACDELVLDGWTVIFIPMHFPHDIAIAKQVAGLMKNRVVILKEKYNPLEMLSLTKNMDIVIGMRLHALINSTVAGVPSIGLSYDPKIDRFLEQAGQHSLTPVHDLRSSTLLETVKWTVEKNEDILRELAPRREALYYRARQSAQIALNLLKRI